MSAPRPVTKLLSNLQRVLWMAHANELLDTAPEQIKASVKLGAPPDDVARQDPSAWAIIGGIKDHKRVRHNARLVRADGAWLHFTIAVTETAHVLAYDFELVFEQCDEPRTARFVRFDLNPLGHDNDLLRDRRSHLHPGHDDIQVPYEQRDPVELLRLIVEDLAFIKER